MKISFNKKFRLYHVIYLIILYGIYSYFYANNQYISNNTKEITDLRNKYRELFPITLIGPNNSEIKTTKIANIYFDEINRIKKFSNTTGIALKELTFSDALKRYPSNKNQPDHIILHKPDINACVDYSKDFAWSSNSITKELTACMNKGEFLGDTCSVVSHYFRYDPYLPSNTNPNLKTSRSNIRRRTFLELGALGGQPHQSMTLVFERTFGFDTWDGLGVEATPANFAQLMKNRPCISKMEFAAATKWGTTQFTGWGGCCSGIEMDMNTKHKKLFHGAKAQSFTVGTAPISDVLLGAGIKVLDFFVLDVEGGELSVLKGMNFKDVKVQMLMIEVDRNTKRYKEIADMMHTNGFFQDEKHFKSWHSLNTLWINKEAESWIGQRYRCDA